MVREPIQPKKGFITRIIWFYVKQIINMSKAIKHKLTPKAPGDS